MRTRFLLVATAALLSLSMVPTVQAQEVGITNPNTPTPTTLYFHVINVQDMPINTQVPDTKYVAISSFGPQANTLRCLDPLTGDVGNSGQGTGGTTSQVFHTNYGYSSPSYVEYDYQNANGEPRTHPERGISYDAIFDTNTPFTVTWYVVVDNGGQPQNTFPTPTLPVKVKVTMRGGDAISVDDRAYDTGPEIATGESVSAILMPGGANGGQFSSFPGPTDTSGNKIPPEKVSYEGLSASNQHMYKFTVPMSFSSDRVTRAQGFNVRIDMYADVPQCNDPTKIQDNKEYVMTGTIAPYTDGGHRPLMNFAIMNPIRLEYLHPQFVGDDLVVHTSMNSAWGNYDVGEISPLTPQVDDSYIQVTIDGPSPATSLAKAALVQRFHEHYHHQEAVDVTYVWPYKTDRAQNGLYTVHVSFKNDQGTAQATGTAQFEIGKGVVIGCGGVQEASQKLNNDCAQTVQTDGVSGDQGAPGFGLVAGLAAIGAVALVLRRRQA